MRRGIFGLGVATLAMLATTAAHAGDSEDFAGCDGLLKPKGKEDGMRGAASVSGYNQFSSLFGVPQTRPMNTIQSCNRALANPKLLPTQTLRRAHLHRARAAAYLEMGKPADALIDLDAAELATAVLEKDIFYRRSMGASLMLLRAITKAGLGETEEAARLAEEAGALRPYAVQVQMAAWLIRDATRKSGGQGAPLWGNLTLLEPNTLPMLVSREVQQGNFAGAVELSTHAPLTLPAPNPPATNSIANMMRGFSNLNLVDAMVDLAYARAATGDLAGARAAAEEVRAWIAARNPPASAASAPDGTSAPEAGPGLLAKRFEPRLQMVDARIALGEGRLEEATAIATGKPFALNAAAIDLIEALNKATGKSTVVKGLDKGSLLAQQDEARRKSLGGLSTTLLIAPESHRNLIDYEKSRPNILSELVGAAFSLGTTLLDGVDRTAGFKSTPNADGSLKVEYVGSTNSAPMVQEMTLLRAAEMAREANKPRFAILDRKDYTRYMTTTQYGIETSRIPTGHKTELTVRFLDEGEAAPAFNAVEVIDALGPLYYESKAATRTAVR